MRAFVTGGTGFIGSALVKELRVRGDEVIALVRDLDKARWMRMLGVQTVCISLFDTAALAQAMVGCDVVFHLAGENKWGVPDPSEMMRVNIEGTMSVANAAKAAGVPRLVFTSSAATIGEAKGTIGREDSPYRGWSLSAYETSKRAAEHTLLGMNGLDVIIVNPSSVQGPGRVAGTGKIMLAIINGTLPAFVNTQFSICHVTDCVAGLLGAAERGRPDERYLLSGATVTTDEMFAQLSIITGLELRPRYLPHWLARLGVWVMERIAWWQGKDPSWSTEKMRAILHGHNFDASKSERELGLAYTPLSQALLETVRWYMDNGLVTRRLPNLEQ